MFFSVLLFAMPLCTSCLYVPAGERADLLALLCGV